MQEKPKLYVDKNTPDVDKNTPNVDKKSPKKPTADATQNGSKQRNHDPKREEPTTQSSPETQPDEQGHPQGEKKGNAAP